jgi:hypothetical protein
MNININNYEDYFLLYADNELSAEDKNMVEIFVEHNTGLEEEFLLLKQSVLKADNSIKFEGKSFLFKQENTFINATNYPEKFLLYNDNELSKSEIEVTEKFVLSHPDLLPEFNVLQQVKYAPDTAIVFPNKNLLYKKEEDIKVIPFRWKALAAAILLGIGLWTGVKYLQTGNIEPVVITNPVAKKSEVVKPVVKQKEEEQIVSKETSVDPAGKPVISPSYNSSKNIMQPKKNIAVQSIHPIDKLPEINSKKAEPNDLLVRNSSETKKDNNLSTPIINSITIEPNNKSANNVSTSQSTYAQTASYIAEVQEKSENYVFYHITQEEFQKSKVGIFFKKVKRAIERKNPLREKTFKVSSIQETLKN